MRHCTMTTTHSNNDNSDGNDDYMRSSDCQERLQIGPEIHVHERF